MRKIVIQGGKVIEDDEEIVELGQEAEKRLNDSVWGYVVSAFGVVAVLICGAGLYTTFVR